MSLSENPPNKEAVRRDVLKIIGIGIAGGGLAYLGSRAINAANKSEYENYAVDWPQDKERILEKIKELNFPQGAYLGTTIFPRKMMWEEAQRLKKKGMWTEGDDESGWMDHIETIDQDFKTLSEAGIKVARLVIPSFETRKDGKTYDWTAMDTAIELLIKNGITPDIALGPVDWPYGPAGIRLPDELLTMLRQEMEENGIDKITLSLEEDYNLPISSAAIRDFALNFLEKQLERYGNDPRIGKFYVSNEWPDDKRIEGLSEKNTMKVTKNFMLEVIKRTKQATDKQIGLNTNIHVSELEKLKDTFGEIFEVLEDQGVLGVDAYPTQELTHSKYATTISSYDEHIGNVREEFSYAEVNFVELEAQPWPKVGVVGKSWVEIMDKHFEDTVFPYTQEIFPPSIEKYMLASKIKEIGLWGVEFWLIATKMGYDFPLKMLSTLNTAMEKNR